MIPPGLSGDALNRFIGGRRHYNFMRQIDASDRRYRLMFTWAKNPHLSKSALAEMLGVHRSTITRDIQAIKRDGQARRRQTCPMCEGMGKVDTGPDLATMMEINSNLHRFYGQITGDQDLSGLELHNQAHNFREEANE